MGTRVEKFDIKVSVGGYITILKRIDIENYRIFSEFIDNSLQSFLDHKKVLQDKRFKVNFIIHLNIE